MEENMKEILDRNPEILGGKLMDFSFIEGFLNNIEKFVFSKLDTSSIKGQITKVDNKSYVVIGDLGYGFRFQLDAAVVEGKLQYDVILYYYVSTEIDIRLRIVDFGGTYEIDVDFDKMTDEELEDYILETFTIDILTAVKVDRQTPIVKILFDVVVEFLKRVF